MKKATSIPNPNPISKQPTFKAEKERFPIDEKLILDCSMSGVILSPIFSIRAKRSFLQTKSSNNFKNPPINKPQTISLIQAKTPNILS